jgi:exodeoxyribonuclease VII large subunit
MKNVFSVSQVNSYIKNLFVQDYVLNDIWIKGEISNYKVHSSGHVYFTLKDGQGSISCVLFSRYREMMSFSLEDGMNIIARGYVSVYERSGQYQVYVQQVQLEGIGALYQRFEALKKSLDEKGFFDANHKKVLPKYPKQIGIVTSATGAAIRDMIQVAKRRNPYIQLLLYPTLVQGQNAARHIVKGIEYLDKIKEIDIIIIGRGGGSIEDLWAFNEAEVAEAIFKAKTPIISAVGHETDFTISDFVADLRAPTPSAAAEIAVPTIEAIDDLFLQYRYKMNTLMSRKIESYRKTLDQFQLHLNYANPLNQIRDYQQYLMDLENRMKQVLQMVLKEYGYKLNIASEKIKALSPLRPLEKGFALVSNEQGQIVTSIEQVEKEQPLYLQLLDGELQVLVSKKSKKRWDYNGEG